MTNVFLIKNQLQNVAEYQKLFVICSVCAKQQKNIDKHFLRRMQERKDESQVQGHACAKKPRKQVCTMTRPTG